MPRKTSKTFILQFPIVSFSVFTRKELHDTLVKNICPTPIHITVCNFELYFRGTPWTKKCLTFHCSVLQCILQDFDSFPNM